MKKDDKNQEELIQLGVCHKPHGIKGGFTFLLDNNEDSILSKGMEITLFPKSEKSDLDESGEVFTIDKISFGNKVIAYLNKNSELISDRNVVESILPFIIKVSRASFPELDDGEIYLSDILGLDVRDVTNDKIIGVVHKTFDNGAQTILTIKMKSGALVDVPFIENFIPIVDLDKKEIGVHLPHYV